MQEQVSVAVAETVKKAKSTTKSVSYQSHNAITRIMENHHALFYQMWCLGKPYFTDAIDTAAVSFDPTNGGAFIRFLFNPDFWDSMDDYQRAFVIAHESLHVLFNHGPRFFNGRNNWVLTSKYINIATDIVINETLVRDFGFERERINCIDRLSGACFIDTVFKEDDKWKEIEPNRSSEYYFNRIMDKVLEGLEVEYVEMDDHSSHQMPGYDELDIPPQLRGKLPKLKDVIKELNQKIPENMKKNLNDVFKHKSDPGWKTKEQGDGSKFGGSQAGSGEGDFFQLSVCKREFKKKWETILFEWAKQEEVIWRKTNTFFEPNRRLVASQQYGSSVSLPHNRPMRFIKKDKIDVMMFQDTSGSCWHLAERFFAAARSLDPKKFNVRLFCFDTKVYETDLESGKVYGGGGTSFSCIEHAIQATIQKEKIPYPKAVFVITDGAGDIVNPMQPKNWYWFLTEKNESCIPKESKIFDLADYE